MTPIKNTSLPRGINKFNLSQKRMEHQIFSFFLLTLAYAMRRENLTVLTAENREFYTKYEIMEPIR